ncbi:MAG: non-ribosomal peptide synthetase [Pseudomonadales bacterium]
MPVIDSSPGKREIESLWWHHSPFSPPDLALIEATLPTALARLAGLWPERTAVFDAEGAHSFRDLANRAAGLAEKIRAETAPAGPVALLQPIGLDAVAAWFACALAGRSFLLLEPGQPPARLHDLIETAGATLLIDDASQIKPRQIEGGVRRLVPDRRDANWPASEGLGLDEPAMIFPTSGSTGTPKLVVYSMRTLQVKAQASIMLMRVPAAARVVIAGSHGNYGFLHHALVFLLSGGAICLADMKAGGVNAVINAIVQQGARHARFTPSMFRTFASMPEAREALAALEGIRFSGESLLMSDLNLARTVLNPSCLIQNVYGSTESSLFVWSSGDEIDSSAPTIPIGQLYPLSSYALRPLNESTSDPSEGELLIRSAHHALGDLRAGSIHPDRFPSWSDSSTERVFTTGDIARRLPGGGLVLLGRMGRMVKVRGQRVFLSEVENALRGVPGVTGAAVVDHSTTDGEALYGFITREPASREKADARAWIARRVPDFMVPRQILDVPVIPLLPGAKVDYASLRAWIPERREEIRPANPPEGRLGQLLDIWHDMLGTGAGDLRNDFFTLGGDSLKLMELMLAIERSFATTLPVDQFLDDPTLPGLARLLDIPLQRTIGRAEDSITLRPAWYGTQPSRGIALAMPGYHGSAMVFPFVRAGLFADYDVWAADAEIRANGILQDESWWQSAISIADKIRHGAMPAPRIIFGYSVGGSIAWLVGSLLAGSPQQPEYVVMIDATPMHHLPVYRSKAVEQSLAATTRDQLPVSILVHRDTLAAAGIRVGRASLWQPEDNVRLTISVPTVEHLDLMRSDVLALCEQNIRAALDSKVRESTALLTVGSVGTTGARIHRLIASGDARHSPELDDLVRIDRATLGKGHSAALLFLTLRDGNAEQKRLVLDTRIAAKPRSRLWRYARYRLDVEPGMLCPSPPHRLTPLAELDIGAIERVLAAHHCPDFAKRSIVWRRVGQLIDITRAIFTALPYRERYRSVLTNRNPR